MRGSFQAKSYSSYDAFADGALLDVLHRVRHMHDAFHIDAGRDDVVGIDRARLDQVLDLRHRHLARGRHHRIEVARGLSIDEVALGIAFPRVHDGEVGDDPALEDIARTVDLALLLALGDQGARAGPREEGRNAGTAGADALGERALRIELDLELAREVLLREGF